eukprot:COSAG01_NODE_25037_length_757_cov_14.095745_1_plen_66_part_00
MRVTWYMALQMKKKFEGLTPYRGDCVTPLLSHAGGGAVLTFAQQQQQAAGSSSRLSLHVLATDRY